MTSLAECLSREWPYWGDWERGWELIDGVIHFEGEPIDLPITVTDPSPEGWSVLIRHRSLEGWTISLWNEPFLSRNVVGKPTMGFRAVKQDGTEYGADLEGSSEDSFPMMDGPDSLAKHLLAVLNPRDLGIDTEGDLRTLAERLHQPKGTEP